VLYISFLIFTTIPTRNTMSVTRKINEISPELAAIVNEARPKKDQTIWFESVRPKSRGTTVLPHDRIYDPGIEDFVDIAYITGTTPAKGPGGTAKENIGRIQFTRNDFGRMGIRGGSKKDDILFTFLFLTNQNATNQGKPWFVEGNNLVFKQDEPKKRSADSIAFDRQVRQAMDSIDMMDRGKLIEIASGLDMDWVNDSTADDEIIRVLYDISKKNPGKVLGLDKDVSLKMKSDVKDAERLGVIKKNDELQMWVWPESQERICSYQEGMSPADSMVAYFKGTGSKTYQYILQLNDREKDLRQKKKDNKK
jgi:hypothetical protein